MTFVFLSLFVLFILFLVFYFIIIIVFLGWFVYFLFFIFDSSDLDLCVILVVFLSIGFLLVYTFILLVSYMLPNVYNRFNFACQWEVLDKDEKPWSLITCLGNNGKLIASKIQCLMTLHGEESELVVFTHDGVVVYGVKVSSTCYFPEFIHCCSGILKAHNGQVFWHECFLGYVRQHNIFVGWSHLFFKLRK